MLWLPSPKSDPAICTNSLFLPRPRPPSFLAFLSRSRLFVGLSECVSLKGEGWGEL